MPPKKKCTHKARKAELVFLERPREGPVHCYETPLPSAKKPRRVLTKPVDQNTSAWVGIDYPSPYVPQQQFSSFSRVSQQKATCPRYWKLVAQIWIHCSCLKKKISAFELLHVLTTTTKVLVIWRHKTVCGVYWLIWLFIFWNTNSHQENTVFCGNWKPCT